MPMKEILVILAGLAIMLFMLIKKQGIGVIKSGLYGMLGLAAVNLSSFFTGIAVSLSFGNLIISLLLGLPGVILTIFMGMI